MLSVNKLCKKFHQHHALNEVSFSLRAGEVLSIIGPSGAGKSTLLRSLNLLEKPDSGEIVIRGKKYNLAKMNYRETLRLRRQTAMVFQHFNLFSRKTALENVMEGLIIVQKKNSTEAKRLAYEELDKVGLVDRANYYPKQLSGGQQQRVAIARALALKPDVLLLDEPTSALDPELVNEVQRGIKLAAQAGNTMILVSHEMNFVREVSDRILYLEQGEIVENIAKNAIFNDPASQKIRKYMQGGGNNWFYQI